MSEVVDATADREGAVARAVDALRQGELVVLPTDTVYGVAADAFNPAATAKVFEAKRRSRRFPLPVLVRSPKQLLGLMTSIPEQVERLMAAYWPGALTILVPAEPSLTWDLGENEGSVAVRMPFDDVTLDIIRAVGPLAVTSANLSGQPPSTDVEAARRHLEDRVAVYVDGGPRRHQRPSTIVDLTRPGVHVIRAGSISGDQVLAVARGELDAADVAAAEAGEEDWPDATPVDAAPVDAAPVDATPATDEDEDEDERADRLAEGDDS